MLPDEKFPSNNFSPPGQQSGGGAFNLGPSFLKNKPGLPRHIYNAKVNIYRRQADPIYLGVQDKDLAKLQTGDPKLVKPSAAE